MSAETLLQNLEAIVLMEEEAHRYEPQGYRSIDHVVDAALVGRFPRVTLHLAALYPAYWERIASFGNRVALENHDVKPHLAYAAVYEGRLLPLSRATALEVLELGDVPARLVPAPESAPEALTEQQIGAIFESANGPGPLLGAAKRIERRRGEAGYV